jgi:hypothetical protein
MIRKISGCVLLTVITSLALGQSAWVEKEPKEKKSYFYGGVQVNQLVRQILNFGGSSSSINNPYLFNIGINSAQTGWGVNMSHGFTHTKFNDGDAFTDRETKINDQFFRLGFERKTMITQKWMISWGFDVVAESQKNSTKTKTNQGGGGGDFSSEIETIVNSQGVGPRFAFNYQLGEKILVGTECNYYFKTGKTTQKIKTSFDQDDEDSDKFRRFQFNLPAVIYLIFKL